ncbi:Fimbrial protein [Vibrio furnissii]|nr:type 1 fimbrial protein [Vibrio furnissii]UON50079.1 type 1 fimbrial protein [Vibrio furnissii]SUQ32301.1 Fimbrial protein [Vibrio furnissii]
MNTLMKKTLVASAFGLLLSANGAMAATSTAVAGGTISFTGSVTDTTCDVTTSGDKDFTVTLSPVALTDIANPGVASAGAKQFDMKVAGCTGYTDGGTESLHITFSGSNISDDELYLKNDTGTATGVGITITSDGTAAGKVDLNKAVATGLGENVADGTISYFANYYNFAGQDAATAGTVVTSATYTFDYQ